jgi:hypothetical protein
MGDRHGSRPPLAIKVLDVTVYPPSGWGYTTTSTHNPTWELVEAAICALDHHCHPFIFLGLREQCEGENCMSVLGGRNGYAISVADATGGWLNYCDPSHTGGEIPVWTSDQGYYPSERYVTYDLNLVLQVARCYAERGQLDTSVQWES